MENMDSTILAALGTIVAAGGTAITTIYRLLVSKLNDCEEKHSVQTAELISVSKRVSTLEGRQQVIDEIAAKKTEHEKRHKSE